MTPETAVKSYSLKDVTRYIAQRHRIDLVPQFNPEASSLQVMRDLYDHAATLSAMISSTIKIPGSEGTNDGKDIAYLGFVTAVAPGVNSPSEASLLSGNGARIMFEVFDGLWQIIYKNEKLERAMPNLRTQGLLERIEPKTFETKFSFKINTKSNTLGILSFVDEILRKS